MFRYGSKKIKSWMLIYAGLVAVFMSAAKGHEEPQQRGAAVSPVSMSPEAPTLTLEAVVRRADI